MSSIPSSEEESWKTEEEKVEKKNATQHPPVEGPGISKEEQEEKKQTTKVKIPS